MPLARRRAPWARLGRTALLVAVVGWLVSFAGVLIWEVRDTARPAAAIVVLGAAQYGGRPSPVLRSRLDHAVQLWRRGLAPRLVLTGGTGTGDTESEAAVGRRYVMRLGVPDSALLLETRGRTTSESMREVASLMVALPSREVILVSDPFHMLRLSILARRFGMIPLTSPTRTSPISRRTGESMKYAFSESVKVPLALLLERADEQ